MPKTTIRIPGLLLLCVVLLAGCDQTQGERPSGDADPSSTIVARIGNKTVTMAELEKEFYGDLKVIEQERFEVLQKGLRKIKRRNLIAQAAEAAGMTREEYLKAEIDDKLTPPTEEQIARLHRTQKEVIDAMDPEMRDELIHDGVMARKRKKREKMLYAQLEAETDIQILLEPPRGAIEARSDSPSRGPEDALVTIIEFGDFECHFCKRSHMVVERLLNEYHKDVRYVFQDYPVPIHERAIPASQAARCAEDQGKFWDYFEHLMGMKGDLSDIDLQSRAAAVGLDTDQFSACYESERHLPDVEDSFQYGQSVGVTGTPTFFINGRILIGSKTYEEMKAIVDEELARAQQTASSG